MTTQYVVVGVSDDSSAIRKFKLLGSERECLEFLRGLIVDAYRYSEPDEDPDSQEVEKIVKASTVLEILDAIDHSWGWGENDRRELYVIQVDGDSWKEL